MTIKILVDMNLSPEWVPALVREGWEAVHWSAVGIRVRRTTNS
jgi:predicted nuclease of predicted toxin-antitoxin system